MLTFAAPVEIHDTPPAPRFAGLATKPRSQWAHCYAPTAPLDFRAINSCRSEMSWTPSMNHRRPSSGDKTNNVQPNVQPRVETGATKIPNMQMKLRVRYNDKNVAEASDRRREVKSSAVHEVHAVVTVEFDCQVVSLTLTYSGQSCWKTIINVLTAFKCFKGWVTVKARWERLDIWRWNYHICKDKNVLILIDLLNKILSTYNIVQNLWITSPTVFHALFFTVINFIFMTQRSLVLVTDGLPEVFFGPFCCFYHLSQVPFTYYTHLYG